VQVEGIPIGIVIKALTVKGLSNAQVIFDQDGNPRITVVDDTVTFHAKLPNTQAGYQRPPDVPPQVCAHGQLLVTIAGTVMPPGTIDLVIHSVDDLTGVFTATERESRKLSTLQIDFTHLSVNTALTPNNLVIAITLDTVFVQTINQVLNLPDIQAKLIGEVNTRLASPDILASLSQVATEQARKALANN
jgi:hypothetical protein